MIKHYDVVIIGAGPAGSSCALALRNAGLSVALVDKDVFPRHKTCGDAIPGKTLKHLKEIYDSAATAFEGFEQKKKVQSGIVFLRDGKKAIEVSWVYEAYNSTRLSFDHFLFNLVKSNSATSIYENFHVSSVSRTDEKIQLTSKNSDVIITCDMVVGSDGANSIVSRTFLGNDYFQANSAVALSAYYENVSSPVNSNCVFLLKDIPGYFWIFPLHGNLYNVGFGMYRKADNAASVNYNAYFHSLLADHSVISKKFVEAKRVSDVTGFRLPLAGNEMTLSGERFLLTGDAAHLIDPLAGHGIDKAVKSGRLAAEHIKKCFHKKDFSAVHNLEYDKSVYRSLGSELKESYRMMTLITRAPWLVTLLYYFVKLRNRLFLSTKTLSPTKYRVYPSIK